MFDKLYMQHVNNNAWRFIRLPALHPLKHKEPQEGHLTCILSGAQGDTSIGIVLGAPRGAMNEATE